MLELLFKLLLLFPLPPVLLLKMAEKYCLLWFIVLDMYEGAMERDELPFAAATLNKCDMELVRTDFLALLALDDKAWSLEL